MSNNQWVEIVAKLTLARSILATVILDIDNAVFDINAGHSNLSKQSAEILTNMIQGLAAASYSIGDIAVDIPGVFLQLNGQVSQSSTQTESLEKLSQTVSDSLVNGDNFNSQSVSANGHSHRQAS